MTDALLLVTPACPHCPGMMKTLTELLKQGTLGRLEMVNIVSRPETAARYHVRSVPWLKIGDFEFSGAMTRSEIEKWIGLADGQDGRGHLLAEQLKTGGLDDVLSLVRRQPEMIGDLLSLLTGTEVPIAVRIGVSAVIESFEGQPERLREYVPDMLKLTHHEDPATRADGCHFLGITGGEEARAGIEACLDDPVQMVREIAQESLDSQLIRP